MKNGQGHKKRCDVFRPQKKSKAKIRFILNQDKTNVLTQQEFRNEYLEEKLWLDDGSRRKPAAASSSFPELETRFDGRLLTATPPPSGRPT